MERVKISLVFMPCEKVNAKIKGVKDLLKSLVGWYSSCNSAGHVTICELEIERNQLEEIKSRLSECLQYENAQYVYFNDYSVFQNGATYTYYIAPTTQSKIYFNQRAQAVCDALKGDFSLKAISREPHLSIGRRLEEEMLLLAKSNLKAIDLDFYCDGVYIRIFNPKLKQYEVYSKVPFGGKERKIESGQLSLNFI